MSRILHSARQLMARPLPALMPAPAAMACTLPFLRSVTVPSISAPLLSLSLASHSSSHSSNCRCCSRSFHTRTPIYAGSHAHDDGAHFHGSDFLSRENVQRRVRKVLEDIDKIDKSKLDDENSSWKSLGLDSLDEVEVVMMLEDEFVIDIQDEVATNILTIKDAIDYITNHPFAANDEVHH